MGVDILKQNVLLYLAGGKPCSFAELQTLRRRTPQFFSYTPFRLSADFTQLLVVYVVLMFFKSYAYLCVVFLVTETNLVTLCAFKVDVSMNAYITPDATPLLFSEVHQ